MYSGTWNRNKNLKKQIKQIEGQTELQRGTTPPIKIEKPSVLGDGSRINELGAKEMALSPGNETGARQAVIDEQISKLSASAQQNIIHLLQKSTSNNTAFKILEGLVGSIALASGILQAALLTSFVYFTTIGIKYILSGQFTNYLKDNSIGILTKNIISPLRKGDRVLNNPKPTAGIVSMQPSIFSKNFETGLAQWGTKGTILHIDNIRHNVTSVKCAPLFIRGGSGRLTAWKEHIIPFPMCYCPYSSAKTFEDALDLEACIFLLRKFKDLGRKTTITTDFTNMDILMKVIGIDVTESVFNPEDPNDFDEKDRIILKGLQFEGADIALLRHSFQVGEGNKRLRGLLLKVGSIVFEGNKLRKVSNYHFYEDISSIKVVGPKMINIAKLLDPEKIYEANLSDFAKHERESHNKIPLSINPSNQKEKIEGLKGKRDEILKVLETLKSEGKPDLSEEIKTLELELDNLNMVIASRIYSDTDNKGYYYINDDWAISWTVQVIKIDPLLAQDLEFWRLFGIASKLCSKEVMKVDSDGVTKSTVQIDNQIVNVLLKTLYDNDNLKDIKISLNRMRLTLLEKNVATRQSQVNLQKSLEKIHGVVSEVSPDTDTVSEPVKGKDEVVFDNPINLVTQGGGIRKKRKKRKRRTHKKSRKSRKSRRTHKNQKTRKKKRKSRK